MVRAADEKGVSPGADVLVQRGVLEFQFNPSEYSVKKSGSWQTPKRSMGTKAGGKPHYLGSNPQSVSLQIFFDGWEDTKRNVVHDIDQLLDWCAPTSGSVNSEKPAFLSGSLNVESTIGFERSIVVLPVTALGDETKFHKEVLGIG